MFPCVLGMQTTVSEEEWSRKVVSYRCGGLKSRNDIVETCFISTTRFVAMVYHEPGRQLATVSKVLSAKDLD